MRPLRAAGVLAILALGWILGAPAVAPHRAHACQEGPDTSVVDWQADDQACRCRAGNSCWHYLRSPFDPPWDPCWCNFCTKVSKHDGTRAMPEGWNESCASNGKPDCFLKRHAEAWSMACSECLQKTKCCTNPSPENCPRCERSEPSPLADRRKDIERRYKREAELFGNKDVVVVWSTHFYVVTDIPSLKIRTQGGSFRVANTHELAHIYAERAEKAYREFVQHFGADVTLSLPSAIFLPKKEGTAAKIQARYNSSDKTNLVYGGSTDGRIADGFCFNGFCNSLQKSGGDDEDLHHAVRHQIGHVLVSCWVKVNGQDRCLPRWLFEGVAHWLAKRLPPLHDKVVWCANEGSPISGSGKDWENDARKIAGDVKTIPVERLLAKATIGLMDYDDHVRSWSYLELALAEDRENFVKILRALRDEVGVRKAWVDAMGCTPDEWDQRWKDRVLGRRPTLGALPRDKGDEDGPGAADRRAIRIETDMQNLVARIRGIGTCTDPRTAKTLVEQFARDSEAVREVLVVILCKTTDPKVVASIRETGLTASHPMVRAYTARVLGFLADAGSLEGLRLLAADTFWMARAEAALALMRLADPKIADSVRPLLDDGSPKVRIAALDALGASGKQGEKVLSVIAKDLDHETWQVRSATAECLGAVGSMRGVDPLIARMTMESGRIRKDCYDALKKITRDDLGLNPENWSKWWTKEKARAGGIPAAPQEPQPVTDEDARYGVRPPGAYGVRLFDERIGYVLDMSNSMFNLFDPDDAAVKMLRRKYKGATKFDISREEICQSIQGLDPRAKFNVMVFSNKPRWMNNGLVQALPDQAKKAESFLRACRSAPGAGGGGNSQLSNFFDAFRSVLDLPPETVPPPGLQNTPDTMFFLTDGEPTLGEIIDADELLVWFTGLNRYARMRVHVVAYGNLGIDLTFLGGLAAQNGGVFTNIPEARNPDGPAPPGTTPR